MILHASVVCISLSHGVGEPIPYARGEYMHPIHGNFFSYSYVIAIKD